MIETKKKIFLALFSTLVFGLFAAEKTDKYIDTKYSTESYCNLVGSGSLLRMEFFGRTGTFNIFCTAPKNPDTKIDPYMTNPSGTGAKSKSLTKEIALFSQAENFLSTGFLLKVDNEVYRLNQSNRIQKELRKIENGAQLVYTTPDHAIRFIAEFTFMSSKPQKIEDTSEDSESKNEESAEKSESPDESEKTADSENPDQKIAENAGSGEASASENDSKSKKPKTPPVLEDIIRVRLYTIPIDKKYHSVSIKAILDTVPGEGSSVHFTTNHGTKIRNETEFSNLEMAVERTIVVNSDITTFQFIFDGEGVSPVSSVVMANTDQLYKMHWSPIIRKGRGFTNIRGYDDSAVMVSWPEFSPPPEKYTEHTFYISAATNDEEPKGLYYIDGVDFALQEEARRLKAQKDAEVRSQRKPYSQTQAITTQKKSRENSDKRSNVEFVVPPIKDYQLDPEYIQRLIDRIDALQSSKNVDHEEVARLNAELDAILEKLRKR